MTSSKRSATSATFCSTSTPSFSWSSLFKCSRLHRRSSSEEGSQHQPSGPTSATSLCLCSSWKCCQQWLHIPLVEHINIFLILSLVIFNNYIFSTCVTLIFNFNIHNSMLIILAWHLYTTNVHTLNFSYLKTIHLFYIIQPFIYTIAIKYSYTVILHYLSHTFIYSHTLEYTSHGINAHYRTVLCASSSQ